MFESREGRYNVGETRGVRGQRKSQMCRLGPPERTSGTFSDVGDSSPCFSSLVMMSLWGTLIVQNSCQVWENHPNKSRKMREKFSLDLLPSKVTKGPWFSSLFCIPELSFVDEPSCRWFGLRLGLLSCSRRVLACDEVSLSNAMKHSRSSLPKD